MIERMHFTGIKRAAAITLAALLLALVIAGAPAFASSPTDEILNYTITADVNDDATVTLIYEIEWLVLEDNIGPLEWITLGLPNNSCENLTALSGTISSIRQDGYDARIDFDRSYYEGETVSFAFSVIADNMYDMNKYEDGSTVYYFVPGWFDEIEVDRLVVRWNSDKATGWSGDGNCLVKDGYCTWETSLSAGETFSIEMTYPNDAFNFDVSKSYESSGSGYDSGYYESSSGGGSVLLGGLVWLAMNFFFFRALIRGVKKFKEGAGFGTEQTTTKKVTRTKVVYYPQCQGCGAPREEGQTDCPYCGRSFIQSEEVIEEDKVAEEDKDALKYSKKGEYAYAPNTFVRVNVINVPVSRPRPAVRTGAAAGRPSGGRGGCAHSSCACASCACACACACAGGGRAGCSTKDFYNTNLKLRHLELSGK